MEVMLRFICSIVVCTGGAAAARTAAAAGTPAAAGEEALIPMPSAAAIMERPADPTPGHGNFAKVKQVEPEYQRPPSYTEDVQRMQADVAEKIQPVRVARPAERRTLQLQPPRCQIHQRTKAPTSEQRGTTLLLQKPSLQQQKPSSEERWSHKELKKGQEFVNFNMVKSQAKRPLEKQPPPHNLRQNQKLQDLTRGLNVLGLQQERINREEQRRQEQREPLERHSARGKQQQLGLHPKLERQSFWRREHEEELEATTHQPRFQTRQRQQEGFPGLHQERQAGFHVSWQPVILQSLQRQRVSSPASQVQSYVSSTTDMPWKTEDSTDALRALQHIVQRQVVDFDAPTEHEIHHQERRKDERGPVGQDVQVPISTQGSTADVRGQEQKVLWGGGSPNVQLPQQVNLSQVLIQNSPQLFFNYDQPQQRGTSKKNRQDGSTDVGEYNWQQHVRGQPGRSDAEQQHREHQKEQEQLLQQQQLLLEELFALAHKVDKGQNQLRKYQEIRQQLQMLHLLQLRLIQQLTQVKQGKQKMQGQQQQEHGSRQQQLQRQNVSFVHLGAPSHNTCTVENSPLVESFLEWVGAEKESRRLLALSTELAAAGRAAERPATFSSSTSEANLLSVKYNSLSLITDDFEGSNSRTKDTELAVKELLPSGHSENLTEASMSEIVPREGMGDKRKRPHYPNVAHQDAQKLRSVERPRQAQQKAGQHLQQQALEHGQRHIGDKREESATKQEGGEEVLEKHHEHDSGAHDVTVPLSPADVHRGLLTRPYDSVEQSATGALPSTAAAEDSSFLVSQLSQAPPSHRASSTYPGYTKQGQRKQQDGHPGDAHPGPTSQLAHVHGNCCAKAANSSPNSKKGKGTPSNAGDVKCQRKRSVVIAGSVNKGETAGTQQREREQLERQQRQRTQVKSLSEARSVMAIPRKTSRPESGVDEREPVTATKDGVTNAGAVLFPDHMHRMKKRHSRRTHKSDKQPIPRKVIEQTIDPRGGHPDRSTRRTTPATMPATFTGATRLDNQTQNETTSPVNGERKPSQQRMGHYNKAADSTFSAAEQFNGLPQISVGGSDAREAAPRQDLGGGRENSPRTQKSANRAAILLEPTSQMQRLEILERNMQQIQKQGQKYEEQLAAFIDRVTLQQEELEQRKVSLQQQRNELHKVFSTSEPENRKEQQEAHVNSNWSLQDNDGEGRHLQKSPDGKTKTPLQLHLRKPLSQTRRTGGSMLSKRMKAYAEAAGNIGATNALSSASSSRALQLFNRSMFDAPPTHSTISLCKTMGQPCAAGTRCCEDLQCLTPVNNSYSAPSVDGRGTCQPGGMPTSPTSAFRLPIQIDPVVPRRDDIGIGTTTQGSVFNNGRTLGGGEGGARFGPNAAAGGALDATAAGSEREAEPTSSGAPTSIQDTLGDKNIIEDNNGGGTRRSGFALQYSLPFNSRELTEKDVESDGQIM